MLSFVGQFRIDLIADHHQIMFAGNGGDASSRRPSMVPPVGLVGKLRMIALVFDVTAASNATGSRAKASDGDRSLALEPREPEQYLEHAT